MNKEVENYTSIFVEAVLEKKTESVLALDVSGLTSVADAFIIGSGSSSRQVKSIADSVKKSLSKKGKKPLSMDGEKEGTWVLLDYGDVVIHLFYEPVRRFYDLEGLWMDAPRICESLISSLESKAEPLDSDDEDGYWVEGSDDYEEF